MLGLILALSVLFVALEYSSSPSLGDSDEDDLEEFAEDMALDLFPDHPEPSPPQPPAVTVAPQIKVVDTPVGVPEEIENLTSEAQEGEDDTAADAKAEAEPLPQTADSEEALSFRIVEQIPQFPGGMEALTQWLTQHLKYPPQARLQKIQGRVVVSFIINKDGRVSDGKIEQAVHPLLDREALRIVSLMPRWTPGQENDKPCRTLFAIPIVFQL